MASAEGAWSNCRRQEGRGLLVGGLGPGSHEMCAARIFFAKGRGKIEVPQAPRTGLEGRLMDLGKHREPGGSK